MQKVATYQTVAAACEQLKKEGDKITGRSVRSITGGDFGTVLNLIKEWRQFDSGDVFFKAEVPKELIDCMLEAMRQSALTASEKKQDEMKEALAREAEALSELCNVEADLSSLKDEFEKVRHGHQVVVRDYEIKVGIQERELANSQSRLNTIKKENDALRKQVDQFEVSHEMFKEMITTRDAHIARAETERDGFKSRIEELERENIRIKEAQKWAENRAEELALLIKKQSQ